MSNTRPSPALLFHFNLLLVQEKKPKIDLKDSDRGGHFGFSMETILAIFDLQVTLMLPTKFHFNWPFGSAEEAKNRFQDGGQISDQNDFSYF